MIWEYRLSWCMVHYERIGNVDEVLVVLFVL